MLRKMLVASVLALYAAAGGSASAQGKQDIAIFAGGCFWCVEEAYDAVPGVLETVSGYTGGTLENPTYGQVGTQTTGHYEAVRVVYDASKVSYEDLLQTFWRNVDPFDARGQFCDKGASYLSAIFVSGADQEKAAAASKQQVAAMFSEPIATEILPAATFYPAEDYHQDYHNTNSLKYKYYKTACGRQQRLDQIWGARSG